MEMGFFHFGNHENIKHMSLHTDVNINNKKS